MNIRLKQIVTALLATSTVAASTVNTVIFADDKTDTDFISGSAAVEAASAESISVETESSSDEALSDEAAEAADTDESEAVDKANDEVEIAQNDNEDAADSDKDTEDETEEVAEADKTDTIESAGVSEAVSVTETASAGETANEPNWVVSLESTNGFELVNDNDLGNAVSLMITEDEATELAGGVIGGTYHYCAVEITPTYTLYDSTTKTYAEEDTDYHSYYYDNLNVGIGYVEYVFDIEGSNFYGSDTQYVCFYIEAREVTEDNATIENVAESFVYDGSAQVIEPEIVVDTTKATPTLVEDTDYEITYDDNVNAGTVTATFTFINNYTGELTRTFEITSVTLETGDVTFEGLDDQTYTGSVITPIPTLYYNGTKLILNTDYTLSYNNNINVGTATVTASFMNNYLGTDSATFNIVAKATTAENTDVSGIDSTYTYTGSEITPSPTIVIDGITLVEGTDYDAEYSDNTDVGTATVTITLKGNYSGTITETFEIEQLTLSTSDIEFSEIANQTYTGEALYPEVILSYDGVELVENEDYTLEYSKNTNVGSALITATFVGNYTGTATTNFNIVAKAATKSNTTITGIEDTEYTGEAITPTPTVVVDGTTLVEGTDYDVTYSDNTDAGTATATITFKGNYSGEIDVTYEITQVELTTDDVTFSGVNASYTFTGSEITPVLTITLANGTVLVEGEDYELSYSDNTSAGTATITVTFIGNYTGTAETTFEITAKIANSTNTTITGIDDTTQYTGEAITPSPTVVVDGITLVEGTDYTVTYSDNVDVGDATATITFKGDYVGTIEVPFTITQDVLSTEDVTFENIDATYEFTGSEITPTPTIVYEDKTLVEGTDYDVPYSDNTELGTATITITFKGNYAGTASTTFEIVAREATSENTVITGIEDAVYAGEPITPTPTVVVDGRELTEGVDYDVTYSDNIDAGEATATITFKGDYTGEIKVAFNIIKDTLSTEDVEFDGLEYKYTFTGSEITPEPTIMYGDVELVMDTDYTLSYENNIYTGTATIIATFIGNYDGSASATFEIVSKEATESNTTITGIEDVIYTGEPITPTPTVVVDGITLVEGTDYNVTYSDNTDAGEATATITFKGDYTGEIEVTFNIEKATVSDEDVTFEGIEASYIYTGDEITLTPTVIVDGKTLTEGVDYDLTYSDNVEPGTATITVTFKGNYEGEVETTFDIATKEATEENTVITGIEDAVYTGEPITPTPTVVVDGRELTEGVDYDVTYSDNTNAGEATATITFKGDYTGEIEVTFNIEKTTISDEDVTFEDLNESYTYTGSEITPKPTVIVDGKTLTEGVDYDLTYSDNVEPGTGTITVTFKGNYEGETSTTFTIVAKEATSENTVITGIEDVVYTGEPITPTPTVIVDGNELTEGIDYDVTYSDNTDAGEATATIIFKGDYSGEIEVPFTIEKATISDEDVTFSGVNESYTYTGSEITPTPTIVVDGKTLTEGADYELSYTDNINPGTATIIVSFIGNYDGEVTYNFEITKRQATNESVKISNIDPIEYTGEPITPDPIVTYDDEEIVNGVDYTLSYENNTSVGTATVIVTLIGNYEGEATATFEITAKPATEENTVVSGLEDVVYTGEPVTPKPTVVVDGKELTEGVDYDVTYSNNEDAGEGTATITFKGDYTGEIEVPFTIDKATITDEDVTFGDVEDSYAYTGEPIEPHPTIVVDGKTLTEDEDYTLSYVDNTDVGTATIIITFIGNYDGEVEYNFEIKENVYELSDGNVMVSEIEAVTYNGKEQSPEPVVMYSDVTLVKDMDYTLEYADNINAGTASVVITGMGDYTGTFTATFTINPKEATEDNVRIDDIARQKYTGKEITPSPVVWDITLNAE